MKYTNEQYYQNHLERNAPEKILCAAIWYKEIELKADIPHNRNPFNITEGAVVCGFRHPHCMYTMSALTGLRTVPEDVGESICGFLTNCNRFVDRIEAAKLGWEAGQLKVKPFHNGEWCEVYSEDFY